MPNYSLVANSTFQPFTYQELMMPIERQNQYFEKLAEEYDKMSSQADVLEAMGSSDLDKNSGTYNKYKAYSDNLRKERDNLYANGLNMDSRQRLSDLRRMYNTEIVPIQNAWQKREQEAQMQMKARMDAAARGIDIRFSRDAANSSLDSYMQNPNQGFQVINGQQITNEVANQFKGLASQVQSDGKGNYFIKGKALSPIEYSIITQKGMDWNQYQDFANNPNDPRFANLRGIIENTLNAHGIRNFDENTYNDMFRYGAQGVAAGVGARDVQLHTDAYAKDLMNFQQQVALQDRAHQHAINLARAKGEIGGGNEGGPDSMGDTVALNFSDPVSAGLSMKRKLAKATAEYIYNVGGGNAQSKKIRDYWAKHGGKEAAIKHWETNGFNGSEEWVGKGSSSISNRLGNYLKRTVTDNDDIINIWKSGYAKESRAPQGETSASSYRKNTYGGLDMFGNQITEADYASTRMVPGREIVKGVKAGTKDWGDFDSLSSNGYEVNAVVLRDNPEDLEKWLDRTLSRNMRNGNVKLYDIEKIDADNNYTYSKQGSTSRKDLPQDSKGKIDYSQIHRAKLSNGDYLLYWDDGKETKQKVLKLQDISKEAMSDRDKKDFLLQNIENLHRQNKISKAQREELRKRVLNQDIVNSMDALRRYNVQEEKI